MMFHVNVTDKASEEARKAIDKRDTPTAMLRLGVKGGSCNGYSYVIQFDDGIPDGQRDIFETFGGVTFVVDKKSMCILSGSTLDWNETLMSKGFKFDNPNVATKCGCGSSFSLK